MMMSMNTTQQTKHYTAPELGTVATVRYQGGWVVRLQISPDEFTSRRVVTREYAEAIALRHAARLA